MQTSNCKSFGFSFFVEIRTAAVDKTTTVRRANDMLTDHLPVSRSSVSSSLSYLLSNTSRAALAALAELGDERLPDMVCYTGVSLPTFRTVMAASTCENSRTNKNADGPSASPGTYPGSAENHHNCDYAAPPNLLQGFGKSRRNFFLIPPIVGPPA